MPSYKPIRQYLTLPCMFREILNNLDEFANEKSSEMYSLNAYIAL